MRREKLDPPANNMLFDDRLATVLRASTGGERGVRTQFRQLLDLLGTVPGEAEGELLEQAWNRLADLAQTIPAEEQSRILREPGLRLRNRRLVGFLARGEVKPAAAALATARLSERDWAILIPELPIVARGLLRHRRNLPGGARTLLDRLGVGDLVLPEPAGIVRQPAEIGAHAPATQDGDGIRALLRRIEAFREGRRSRPPARQQLADFGEHSDQEHASAFAFVSDVEGRITWASSHFAPLVIGMRLAHPGPGVIAALDNSAARLLQHHQPLRGAGLTIDAMEAISGEWRIDAEPVFAAPGGRFAGYRGRIRRPVYAEEEQPGDSPGDRMRQALHELRTPVNAIQGFAEIIQQQLFGPAPNEYRALAAAVAVDAAKLLAAFDEIDRLARLETGALEIEPGEADMREVVVETVRRLEGALTPRNAGFALSVSGSPFTIGIERAEAMAIVWRVLATLAGSLAPGTKLDLSLTSDGYELSISAPLPPAMAEQGDPFAIRLPATRPALSAGMFGSGFALRLARAEIAAAGGSLVVDDNGLAISLPLLTGSNAANSNGDGLENAVRQ